MAEHGDVHITNITASDEAAAPAANLSAAIRRMQTRYGLFQTSTTDDDREWPGRIVLEHDDGGRVLLELPLPADVAGAIIQAAGEHDLELAHTDAGNDRQQVVAQAKRITELEDDLERRETETTKLARALEFERRSAADLKCALEEERERNRPVPGADEDGELDGPDEDPDVETAPDSYSVTIHPHPRPPAGAPGPWLIRCYTVTGEHVHSAEGGVSLNIGLDEVKRAITAREHAR